MVEPKRAHWAVAKRILRYVHGTINFELRYTKANDIKLSGFADVYWARSSVDRKSTTGYCFGIASGMTSWCSKKQKSAALSFAEAEYMAASKATCEAIWLRKLLVNLFRGWMEVKRIYVIIRVVSNSLKIQFFMITPNTLIFGVTLSETVFSVERYSWSTLP